MSPSFEVFTHPTSLVQVRILHIRNWLGKNLFYTFLNTSGRCIAVPYVLQEGECEVSVTILTNGSKSCKLLSNQV